MLLSFSKIYYSYILHTDKQMDRQTDMQIKNTLSYMKMLVW